LFGNIGQQLCIRINSFDLCIVARPLQKEKIMKARVLNATRSLDRDPFESPFVKDWASVAKRGIFAIQQ
jgi:hypothetical protein